MAISVAGIQKEFLGLKASINEIVLWLKQQGASRPGKSQGITDDPPAGGSNNIGANL
jgi:hypothetical protein